MTTTPAMPEHIAHVEDWPDDRTSIGLVWDVDPKSVPVGTKLYALATLQAQPAEVSDEDILSLGQRNAWRYKYSSDPAHSSTYTFNDVCLVQFARAILALRPQAVPMTDEQAALEEEEFFLLSQTQVAALLWVLWCHQGASSPVGQPIRFALGMDKRQEMSDEQVSAAQRFRIDWHQWSGITAPAGGEGHRG